MKYTTYINNNLPLRHSHNPNQNNGYSLQRQQRSSSLSASLNLYLNANPVGYSFNNNITDNPNHQPELCCQFQQQESCLSRNKSSCHNISTEVMFPQVVSGVNEGGGCTQVQNKIEMINMKMKCDILLARIENLNVMLPNDSGVAKLKQSSAKKDNKRKSTLYTDSAKRKQVIVNKDINDEYNLSNLADQLVDVFGLDKATNNNNSTNDTRNALILDHYGSGRSEEMKLGDLITDTTSVKRLRFYKAPY